MILEKDYFRNASPRRRKGLTGVFAEYEVLHRLEKKIGSQEIYDLFDAIYGREERLAAQPLNAGPILGRHPLPATYADIWIEAFLKTVKSYRDTVHRYSQAVGRFDKYRSGLPAAIASPRRGAGGNQLFQLMEAGYGAAELGTMEAHNQMRQILQIYFGRYSFDRHQSAYDDEPYYYRNIHPRPSLGSYRHRANVRDSLRTRKYIVDPAIGFAVYIDCLRESEGIDLPGWQMARLFYTDGFLLMPGLDRAAYIAAYISARFDGNLSEALQRFRHSASVWLRYTQTVGGKYEDALLESRNNYAMAALRRATLCLMNAPRNYTYAGRGVAGIVAPDIPPDIYSRPEIEHDWQQVLDQWRKADQAQEARERRLPKAVREKRLARIQAAIEREENIQAELDASRAALPPEVREQKIREAQERRAESDARQARREQERIGRVAAQRKAAKKAAETRTRKRKAEESRRLNEKVEKQRLLQERMEAAQRQATMPKIKRQDKTNKPATNPVLAAKKIFDKERRKEKRDLLRKAKDAAALEIAAAERDFRKPQSGARRPDIQNPPSPEKNEP